MTKYYAVYFHIVDNDTNKTAGYVWKLMTDTDLKIGNSDESKVGAYIQVPGDHRKGMIGTCEEIKDETDSFKILDSQVVVQHDLSFGDFSSVYNYLWSKVLEAEQAKAAALKNSGSPFHQGVGRDQVSTEDEKPHTCCLVS